MNKQILEPVIRILEREGASEDQIADAIADIVTAATVSLYKRAMEALSDDDLQEIENCRDDDEANKLIARLYAHKVGTTPEQLMTVFLEEYVKSFMKEHDNTSKE
jgi:hypothetical protein